MPIMIPENAVNFETEGEKQFYRYLESVAKPDSEYIAWYAPPEIGNRRLDFILFGYRIGLIVFEVKDWALGQIIKPDRDRFTIKKGRQTTYEKNPLKQAYDNAIKIKEMIEKDGHLVSKEGKHRGNPLFPISHSVVFPNINKDAYTEKGYHRWIDTDKIFFWEDMHPASDICTDTTGNCFLQALTKMLKIKFSFELKPKELYHLKQLIGFIDRTDPPVIESEFPYEKRFNRLKGLDNNQGSIARKIDGGHRIIFGPSGSGKTIILVAKAAYLHRYNPDIKNILFVCYNITLVNYIKRLLTHKNVPFGENGVRVKHFYELCSEITGEEIAYENESLEYYEMIDDMTLSKLKDCDMRYDAILVDEGQDFSDNMYKIITALLNKKTDNLTIVLDENQDIYRRNSSWREVGVKARGRVHKISYMYRNTKEISNFASKFIGKTGTQQSGQLELFPDFFDFSGPKPELRQFENFDSITEYVAEKIREIVKTEGCPYFEFAIIYFMKSPGDNLKEPLPLMIKKALESKGILSTWASENYRSKKDYDITTNRVTISTVHSVKGPDYSCVFLLGLDYLSERWSEEQINSLTYVAITRARYQLFIPYIHKSPLINRLKDCM